MSSTKIKLLALTALSTVAAAPASAAIVYPAVTLHGNGASSIANVLVQELNCYGATNYKQGIVSFKDQTKSTFDTAEFNYTPKSPTTANPSYNCATQSVQTQVGGEYVSTGSGDGRFNWANLTDSRTHVSGTNPFEDAGEAEWGNIQFAFSDAAVKATGGTDANGFDNYTSTAKPTAGAAIQIPLYVLPVAIAYPPSYGTKNDGSTNGLALKLNLKFPRKIGTTVIGGLRMTKAIYCGIFTGAITNFNDAALKTANGNQSLAASGDEARFNSPTGGVPIYLVGRSEKSGTTNIFTRALAAQCGTGNPYAAGGGTDQLPAAVLGNAVYNPDGTLKSGTETAGKFGVVANSDGVSNVIARVPAQPATLGDVALNGHLGYIGSDWVLPSTINNTSALLSADLQIGGGFKGPTAANATAASKVLTAPESSANGKYAPSSSCVSTPTTSPNCRANPAAWVNSSSAGEAIANPTAGYPIVGTTNALLYTCYSTAAKRTAIVGFLNLHFGKLPVTQSATAAKFPTTLVTTAAPGSDGLPSGILAKSGIASLPAPVITAIVETFLKKDLTGNKPGNLNLWIQDKLPTNQAGVATLQSNGSCAANTGA